MGVNNGEQMLAETLGSVLGQTPEKFEFVVVDDGSTDRTADILLDWARRFSALRVIRQERAGLTEALILGCRVSSGDLIARQDCGDISMPGRLAVLAGLMRANERLSFVSSATKYCSVRGEFLYVASGTGRAQVPVRVLDPSMAHGVIDGPSHHGAVMFRRSAYDRVGGYRREFYYGQDWDLWYRLAEVGEFQMLPEVLYEARLDIGDISMNNKERQELIGRQSLRALQLRLAGLSDAPALAAAARVRPQGQPFGVRRNAWRGAYFIGECLRRNGEVDAALRYFKQSLELNPYQIRAWLRWLQGRLL